MDLLALAAVVLPSAFVGGALAWLIAERGRRRTLRALQAMMASLADERAPHRRRSDVA